MFVDMAGVGQLGIAQLSDKLVSWKQGCNRSGEGRTRRDSSATE